jgi:hypothetical protein
MSFTLKMDAAVYAEVLDKFQHMMHLNLRNQSNIFFINNYNTESTILSSSYVALSSEHSPSASIMLSMCRQAVRFHGFPQAIWESAWESTLE